MSNNIFEKEQKARAVRYNAYRAKVVEVAALLGGVASDDCADSPHDWARETCKVALPDGAGLFLRLNSHKGRVNISGLWPRSVTGCVYSPRSYDNSDYADITVSESRTPEAIARDIKSRFLPAYLAEHARQTALAKATNDYEAEGTANIVRLAEAAGTELSEHCRNSKSFTSYEPIRFNVSVSGNRAGVDCDGLTVAQAEALIAFVRANFETQKGGE